MSLSIVIEMYARRQEHSSRWNWLPNTIQLYLYVSWAELFSK